MTQSAVSVMKANL